MKKRFLKISYAVSLKVTCFLGGTHAFSQDPLSWAPWLAERRIIGTNNLEPVVSNPVAENFDLARVVARLETPDGLGYCSGSRVGENLFLTNYHCQESIDCENIVIRMGYEQGVEKNAQGIFQCEKILASNETHDYALIFARWVGTQEEVEELRQPTQPAVDTLSLTIAPSVSQQDFPIAQLYAGELSPSMPIVVASHPRGRLKEIDRSSDCVILSTDIISISMRETMTHSCDTEGGSSGSPVISRSHGAILGLHWGGVSNQNFMIPISAVVSDLKSKISESEFAGLNIVTEL